MIDGHCHLDKKTGDCPESLHLLHSTAILSGVKGILLINIPELVFGNKVVIEYAKKYKGFFRVFPTLNPFDVTVLEELEQLKNMGAAGLKLHPRLHGYSLESEACCRLLKKAGELDMPVIVDCFPDGNNLSNGNIPEVFGKIQSKVPQTRIAIGHAGGHRFLDALMISRYFENIYLDLSFTLLYYRKSSVIQDIEYALESSRTNRIFWGSDYPDRPYTETIDLSLAEINNMGLSNSITESLLTNNVKSFLGENC